MWNFVAVAYWGDWASHRVLSVDAGVAVKPGVAVKVALACRVGRGLAITDVLVAVTTTGVSAVGTGQQRTRQEMCLRTRMPIKVCKTGVSIFSLFKVREFPGGNNSEDVSV